MAAVGAQSGAVVEATEANEKTGRSDDAADNNPSTSSGVDKKSERMKRLRDLHMRRNEARKMNHQEVVEEDRRKKLPANWEAKRRRVEWTLQDEEARKAAEEKGEDYDRLKMLEMPADEAERLEKKKKKKNPDQGFSDYAAASFRQYQRLTKQMKPDMQVYDKQKEENGEAFYPTVDDLSYGGQGKVPEANVDRLVADVEKQIEKRAKYSRRRAHYDDADIDYINERNMKFNKKLARFYDPFTAEIKNNLERGTAV